MAEPVAPVQRRRPARMELTEICGRLLLMRREFAPVGNLALTGLFVQAEGAVQALSDVVGSFEPRRRALEQGDYDLFLGLL